MLYSPPLARLIEAFQRLPGVGPKTAQRLAFHVLKQPMDVVVEFAQALVDAKERIAPCSICLNLSSLSPCEICTSPERQRNTLCVVAEARDVYALERTMVFKGLYHVLGGLISPIDGVGPDDLSLDALMARCASDAPEPISEIILALPPSTEGDTTSLYLARLFKNQSLRITRIAFGLPVGGDLEYADSMTLTLALQGRKDLAWNSP